MSATRMYGRWEQPRSAGFFGLTWGVSMLGLGLVITIMLGFMITRSLTVAAVLIATAATIFTPLAVTVGGRSGAEHALLRVQFALARGKGEHLYRAGRFSKIPGACRLPGLLASSSLAEYETPGGKRFGLIHMRRTGHYTVVLRVVPGGKELVDQSTIDAWVDGYGQFLATQGRSGEILAVTAVIESVVDTKLKQHREISRLVTDRAPDFARQVMTEAGQMPGIGVRVEARIAITYRAIGHGRTRRDPGEQAHEIAQRLAGVLSDLARAGLPAAPMRAWELIALARARFDLAAQRDLELAGPDIADTQSWDRAGPVAADEHWDHYRHDGARSITWEMDAAPRGAVLESGLEDLLRPRADVPRKRVAIIYRLHSAADAAGIVDSDFRDALAAEQTERGIASASASIRVDNTRAARQEQARGAGLTRFGVLITVSDRLDADLPGIDTAIRSMAAASRLSVRRCYGTQAAAFAAGLGIGVILPEHTSVPKRVTG